VGGGCLLNQTDDEFGIIPRAIQQVYSAMGLNSGRRYAIRVSYIEIHKEELRDLIDIDNPSKDLHIREDNNGNTGWFGTVQS
jgi:hypothetical protein